MLVFNTSFSKGTTFIRNLHVEGQNTQGTCNTKDKIQKDFSISNTVIQWWLVAKSLGGANLGQFCSEEPISFAVGMHTSFKRLESRRIHKRLKKLTLTPQNVQTVTS